jgi:hypothetical protein
VRNFDYFSGLLDYIVILTDHSDIVINLCDSLPDSNIESNVTKIDLVCPMPILNLFKHVDGGEMFAWMKESGVHHSSPIDFQIETDQGHLYRPVHLSGYAIPSRKKFKLNNLQCHLIKFIRTTSNTSIL